jgi:hypothetical protein
MKKILCLVGAVALGISALSTYAQSSPVSDWMIVWDGHHNVVASAVATESDELARGAGWVYYVPGVPIDPTMFGKFSTVLEEGTTSPLLSDVFGVALGGPGALYTLAFSSDTETVPVPYGQIPPPGPVYQEPGGPWDATMYLDLGLRQQGWTAQFGSDVPMPGVPDGGATALLLGFGVLGLGWVRRMVK